MCLIDYECAGDFYVVMVNRISRPWNIYLKFRTSFACILYIHDEVETRDKNHIVLHRDMVLSTHERERK